jgi:hypothetical protein
MHLMHKRPSWFLMMTVALVSAWPLVAAAKPSRSNQKPARAGDPPGGGSSATPPESRADALIRRGVEQRKSGNDDDALQTFRSAYAIEPTARVRAQIGLAEQALGRWVDAETDLAAALRDDSNAWIAKNAQALRGALQVVHQHVGTVQVLGSPVGAVVKIDDREVGRLPLDKGVRIAAGEIVISVAAPGYIDISRKVTVGPGAKVREIVTLHAVSGPSPVASGARPERPAPDVAATSETGPMRQREAASRDDVPASTSTSTSFSTAQRWGIATLALGVAAGGVGALFASQAISKNRASTMNCTGNECDPIGFENRHAAVIAGDRATIALIATGALLVGGTTLLLVGRHKDEASAWRFTPVVADTRVALVGSTTF